MKEPEKIPLDPSTPKSKKVTTHRLESNIKYLYDDYGYVTATQKNTDENTTESTET